MVVGIIGAGKVGCSIGKYLKEQGLLVSGYFSKSKESVDVAATFTETKAFSSMEEIVAESDILFLTTPDGVIQDVWENMAKMPMQGKIICHFSGSLSSAVFSDREKAGVSGCSIHPMYAFSDKFTSHENLKSVIFTMEGDEAALQVMKPFWEKLGNKVRVISSEKKARYHCAAAMASNLMVGLYQMSLDMLEDCGFSQSQGKELLTPLVQGNIQKVLATSPKEALTGPVERNDVETIEKHLAILTEQERSIYVNLSETLVEVAARKNPEQDYAMLANLLNDWRKK